MIRAVFVIAMVLLLAWSCGGEEKSKSEPSYISGAALYQTHCAICHGENGRKGFADARVLPDSKLTLEQRIHLITNGRGTMMPYRGVLTEEEIKAVARYTLSLK
jgi:cytochrome c6